MSAFWSCLSILWVALGVGYVSGPGETLAAHAACSLACLILADNAKRDRP